jgi:hypothetical protein
LAKAAASDERALDEVFGEVFGVLSPCLEEAWRNWFYEPGRGAGTLLGCGWT